MIPELRRRLSGVFTALVTPFRAGAIDVPALERLIAAQLEAGVAGHRPRLGGTTGEAATLSEAEADEVIRITVAAAKGRAFIMAGTGSNATALAVAKAKARGRRSALTASSSSRPVTTSPRRDGLFSHFRRHRRGGEDPDHALQRARPDRRRDRPGDGGARPRPTRISSRSRRPAAGYRADHRAAAGARRRDFVIHSRR